MWQEDISQGPRGVRKKQARPWWAPGGLTCVQADGSVSDEDNLVHRGRIDKPRGGLAVLVKECREVVADELVRPALMEGLIVPQPVLNVHGDGAEGTMVQIVIVVVEEELAFPKALAEVQG